MYVLGISAFYHDSAACLLKDGEIVAAAQEERFTRVKHDPTFPSNAIKYCVAEAAIDSSEISHVVFYEKPFLKFERLLETYLAFAPVGFTSFRKAMPLWIKDKIFQKYTLARFLGTTLGNTINWKTRLLFSQHHLSHAASAFFPSPFERAAVLTIDGVGEWTTTSIAVGNGNSLQIKKEIRFPHSLGLLFSAFTYYLGFKVNSGEYKVMGLAPYGRPIYSEDIENNLINVAEDGSFHLDMSFFEFATGSVMTNKKFDLLFGGKPRQPETLITQREMDLAASIQKVTEDIFIKIGKDIAKTTSEKKLCLAGGVALNCVANGILLREKIFDEIWIQPAAGDAGGSLGAALAVWHLHLNQPRRPTKSNDQMKGSFLGPRFDDKEIEEDLKKIGASYERLEEKDLINEVVTALTEAKAIGWMQGRMEFGPRSLGARSIIADPRSSTMQKNLNLKVKFRESFRPFAPSVLYEDVNEWFEHDTESPYMLFVAPINENKRLRISKKSQENLFGIEKLNIARSIVPAITHVDFSARIQTVHKETNPRYHLLISRFKETTGCPMLVNTSFNVRGEPIVCSAKDAFNCFMGTDLDVLVINNFILKKENQKAELRTNYLSKYELD